MRVDRIVVSSLLVVAFACSRSSTPPAAAPAPASGTAAGRGGGVGAGQGSGTGTATGTGTASGRGTPAPGGAPAGGRGGTPEQRAARRDSIATLRAAAIAQLLPSIAGKEDMPAGQVFKNVQLMKDVPAKRFLIQMDSVFGRALSRNCADCHIAGDYASDSLPRKRTARVMIDITNAINTTELAKLNRPRTPQINCVTCHRGGSPTNGQIVP